MEENFGTGQKWSKTRGDPLIEVVRNRDYTVDICDTVEQQIYYTKSKIKSITIWYFPRYRPTCRPNYVRVVVADDRTTLLNNYCSPVCWDILCCRVWWDILLVPCRAIEVFPPRATLFALPPPLPPPRQSTSISTRKKIMTCNTNVSY